MNTTIINKLKQHSNTTVPAAWIGKRGVLKGTDGTYYLVCVCGRHVSRRQTEFSVSRYGMVLCIECQRESKKNSRYFSNPEHNTAAVTIKDCQECKVKITHGMMATSLEVTSYASSSGGVRLCRKCLGKKCTTMVKPTIAEQEAAATN